MSKKIKIILVIICLIIIVSVAKILIFGRSMSLDGKYHLINIFACLDSCSVNTWQIADDIVIREKTPQYCEKIVVYDPNGYSTTDSAIRSCYFEVAERLRDKSICQNIARYSDSIKEPIGRSVEQCQKNIDNQNASDLSHWMIGGVSDSTLSIQINKDDQGKEISLIIKDAVGQHLYITKKEKKFGYDFQVTHSNVVKPSVKYPIEIKLTPQNVTFKWNIEINNPYNYELYPLVHPSISPSTIEGLNSK